MQQPDKRVDAQNVPTPTERPRRQIAREEISLLAERIWNERNRPAGQDDAIWLEAESRLQAEAESKSVAGADSRPLAQEAAQLVRPQTESRNPEAAAQTRSDTKASLKKTVGRLRK